MATVTRLNIKQDVVRVLKMRDEALAALPVPLVSTSASSNRVTIIDTKLSRGTVQTNRFDGRMVEIVEAPGTGPADGSIAAADDAGLAISTGTLTVSPELDAAQNLETAKDYIIYPLGLGPEVVNEAISEILRNISAPTIYFPALNSDPMMNESTTLATHWTDVGSPTTTEFITSEATTGVENIFIGEQSIQVNPASAGDGIRTLTFDVHEQEQVYVTCFVRAPTGSIIVTLIDVTNSSVAVDPGAITIDEPAWTEVSFPATVPDNCEQMFLQFTAVAASDDMFIGAPVVVQSRGGRSHSMPSWFTRESQFIRAHYLPQGMQSEDEFSYIPLSKPSRIHPSMNFIEEARAIHPIKVEFDSKVSHPVYLIATREFDDITTNSATTNADREYMRDRVVATIMRDWGDSAYRFWARRAGKRSRRIGYASRAIQIVPNPMVTV